MKKISCQLSFYPDFLIEHTAFSMDKWYSENIQDRTEQVKIIHSFMEKTYGQYIKEDKNFTMPHMVTPYSSIQLFLSLFDVQMIYSENAFADTKIAPLKDVDTIEDLDAVEKIFKNNAMTWIEKVKNQIAGFKIDDLDFPLHMQEIDGIKDLEMVHCPLTIGYKLFGEKILYLQYDDEQFAEECLTRVAKWAVWLMEKIRQELMNRYDRPKKLLISACSACFVSPDYWDSKMNPLMEFLSDRRDVFFHSCGTINNHLDTFKSLSGKINFLKFDCRESSNANIKKASELFGDTEISYMFSPALCIGAISQQMKDAVDKAIVDTGDKALHLILMLPGGSNQDLGTVFLEQATKNGASIYPFNKFRFV